MTQALLSDFQDLTALWGSVSRRSAARAEVEPVIFNQMAVALAGRLPPGPGPALTELHGLAAAIAGRGFWPEGPLARITAHEPGDRIAISAEAFGRLSAACLDELS